MESPDNSFSEITGILQTNFERMGISNFNSFQNSVYTGIRNGNDVNVSAPTGSGKTTRCLAAILHELMLQPLEKVTKLLMLYPTQQLVTQTGKLISDMTQNTGYDLVTLYNTSDIAIFNSRRDALRLGPAIIAGTPDRVLVHLKLGNAVLNKLKFFVIDEADRMADAGYQRDIHKITAYLNGEQQNIFLSATQRQPLKEIASLLMNNPAEIHL
jgi:superfamily II DNA/RNA helicase